MEVSRTWMSSSSLRPTIRLRRYSAGLIPALCALATNSSYSWGVRRVRATLVRATNVAPE